MGILEQSRSEALGVALAKLNKNGQQIQAVSDGLAVAALGADRGKASIDRLERLERERPALQSIVDALRTEVVAAIKAERCH
jgi:hypothetical protein